MPAEKDLANAVAESADGVLWALLAAFAAVVEVGDGILALVAAERLETTALGERDLDGGSSVGSLGGSLERIMISILS